LETDFSQNFYQIEIPLSFTDFGATQAEDIWPEMNELAIDLADLSKVKSFGIANQTLNQISYYDIIDGEAIPVTEFAPRTLGVTRIGIKGNPSLGSYEV